MWNGPGGIEVPQVATVTCAPSADVRDVHHCMAVILEPADVELWLSGTEGGVERLFRPWPDGSLLVEEATGVDWSAP